MSTLKGDTAACGAAAESWHDVPDTYDYEVDGVTYTHHTTVDCKRCRKFVR